MKILLVARKALVELWREPQMLILILVFPLSMLLVTFLGYGTVPRLKTYPILVVVQDPGARAPVQALMEYRYTDGRPAFDVKEVGSPADGTEDLKQQRAAFLVVFSTTADGYLSMELHGDATSMAFTRASSLASEILNPSLFRSIGKPQTIRYEEQALAQQGPANDFDAYTPGMIVMAILFLIPTTATLLARELRWGTLKRLYLTRLTAVELLCGVSLSQMVIAILQVLIVFACAVLLGFHANGSFGLALWIGILISFSSVGFGLIVTALSRNDSDAINIGSTFSMLQVFLSGSFFAMPDIPLIKLGGYPIGLFDLIPATHGMLALQQVLSRGAGLEQVGFRMAALGLLSALYFAFGVLLFQRAHMRRA